MDPWGFLSFPVGDRLGPFQCMTRAGPPYVPGPVPGWGSLRQKHGASIIDRGEKRRIRLPMGKTGANQP